LKGGSSITIRSEFPDLREFLWGPAFWSEGYFCESVGYRDEEAVRRYIRDQDKIIVSEKNGELSLGFDGQP
jgi:REP element-mobilizing transposase RayT